MTLRLLIDMNLSPQWVTVFSRHGWPAVHWSEVGDISAPDREIMLWAKQHQYVVFTHDLDFGALLAATQAAGPSVIQVRTQDTLPSHLASVVIAALREYDTILQAGALIIVDEDRLRARILPLKRP